MWAESPHLYGLNMRQDYNDGIDRRVKSGSDWEKPKVVDLPISRDEIEAITNDRNPKAALRAFYRSRSGMGPKGRAG